MEDQERKTKTTEKPIEHLHRMQKQIMQNQIKFNPIHNKKVEGGGEGGENGEKTTRVVEEEDSTADGP